MIQASLCIPDLVQLQCKFDPERGVLQVGFCGVDNRDDVLDNPADQLGFVAGQVGVLFPHLLVECLVREDLELDCRVRHCANERLRFKCEFLSLAFSLTRRLWGMFLLVSFWF